MGSSGPVLPEEGKRNVLITSALPYVNNVPHLGNIIGSVLSADVFARFCKARGHNTLYVCGSDEYGTATETKALEEGLEPAALCAKYHVLHKEIYDWFRIDFDIFGRTPSGHQTKIVQQIFTDLWKNDYIEERETVQPFCPTPGHSKFLADRFVEGQCSICGDNGARGDQCDACGSLLDAFEPEQEPNTGDEDHVEAKATGWLINPRCKLDGAAPEKRSTKHLYLKLDALKDELVAWFKKSSKEGEWSPNCTAVTQSWINKGLLPRGITRDLKWGVPIPTGLEGLSDEEYANKVFYVWFDACIGYVSITANYTDGDNLAGTNWEKWWKNPENVRLYQFMGKDNIPFHTIIFPASQLGTKGNWTQVHKLSTTEYLNYEGGKFSKSKGVGVFGNTAKETGVDPDVWRYYLLSRRPESSDSEFKWQEFIDCNNNDLLKNLGNLNQRILKFCQSKMDGIVPDYTKYTDERIEEHKKEVNEALETYNSNLEAIKLRNGLATVMHISSLGNKLLQDSKLNNQLLADEPERCAAVIGLGINHLQLLASILFPYMPSTAEAILTQIGCPGLISIPETWSGDIVKPGQAIGEPKLLFSQIPASQIDQWREAFGGEEIRKQKALEAEKAAAKKAAKERKKQQKLALRAKEAEATTTEVPAVEVPAVEKPAEAPAAEKQ
ncbi:tRNA synthetases class I (M)-domain-containing protein [Ilyonectria robusta]|uniref:tRNA synthetases class I (M)-domain-containing protein n=1 Tax=Ilyonectria robusta TaxID=1079257 RepID=UPI001E8E8A29|nr:tRNA synthetases class I (M)-domain-containing protein [Ilyonectria robusta]KAH8729521.1 tRNA synthetases class I (M)-domain-containing protein [Ilyonectria robusta]